MLSKVEQDILKAARQAIIAGRNKYLCCAIDGVRLYGVSYRESRAAKNRLTRYISRSLDGHITLGTWLKSKRMYHKWGAEYRQIKARVAWVDWMLGEEFNLD